MTKIFRTSRYLPTNIKVLTIGGLYMLHDDIGYLGNTLYTLYRIISFISCVTAIVWVIAGFVASENFVLVDNAPAVLHTSIFITSAYLLAFFYVKRKRLHKILTFMEEQFSFTSEPGVYEANMEVYIKYASLLAYFWILWPIGSVAVVTLLPMYLSNERVLPIQVWCFYDWQSSPAYEITTAIQLFFQSVVAATFLGSEMLFPCVAYIGVGQFKILGCNLKNMFYTSLLKYGVSQEDVLAYSRKFNVPDVEHSFSVEKNKVLSRIDKLVASDSFQETLWKTFISYIQRHQQLMTYMEDVDDFFSYYFIVKLPMYMLYIILILYLLILGNDRSAAKAAFTYTFGAVTPIFLFTYCGQLFVNEYNQVLWGLYESPWYKGSLKFQKSFHFVQLVINRPVVMTAAKIVNMNIDTFKGCAKFLMSFFTIMQRLKTEQ